MALRRFGLVLAASAFLFFSSSATKAQSGRTPATPESTPSPQDEQDRLKVFTEEIRLPLVAFDDFGNFDPTLEMTDILVLEDGEQQQIRSIRHIPSSVLLVLDLDNQITLAKNTSTTREVAQRVVSRLRKGDAAAVLQFGNGVKVLQNWTTELAPISDVLKTKLLGGKRGRLSEALVAAAGMLKDRAPGSRHIVLITDGIETPGGKVAYKDAVKQLMAAQATVHIISYTGLVREAIADRNGKSIVSAGNGKIKNTNIGQADPTMPTGINRDTQSISLATIDTDRAMRRWYKKYADSTRVNEERLDALAQETGGQILIPASEDAFLAQANVVARDIGAQYVVTYRPMRPLASAAPGEYRKIEVAPRRSGLRLRARRGYIAKTQ